MTSMVKLMTQAVELSQKLKEATKQEYVHIGMDNGDVTIDLCDPMGQRLVSLTFNGDCQFEAALDVVVTVMRQQKLGGA